MLGLARLQWAGIAIAILLATHAAAYAFGWHRGADAVQARWNADRVQIIAAAQARADVLRANGERLAAALEVARANVRVEYVEKIRVVYRAASATAQCLSPDVTAALNRQPIRETVERPGEPPRVVEHPPTPPPPAGGTSELAAAEWIANAQAEHQACRAQVAGLIDWIRSATGKTGKTQ